MNTPKKILIIDDEEGIRESLKLILNDHFDLILTDSPDGGYEILKSQSDIGLVMLDIKMPQINGLEFLPTIKREFHDIPVIMVTGYKSVDTASEAADRGADGYIVKPFDSKDILKAVKKYIK